MTLECCDTAWPMASGIVTINSAEGGREGQSQKQEASLAREIKLRQAYCASRPPSLKVDHDLLAEAWPRGKNGLQECARYKGSSMRAR
jgi:hypothetical protein